VPASGSEAPARGEAREQPSLRLPAADGPDQMVVVVAAAAAADAG